MYHPLLEDISKLKDKDIEFKILDLSKKYHIALSMGQGEISRQILVALEMFKDEQNKRQKLAVESVIKKQDKGFDDLINVE